MVIIIKFQKLRDRLSDNLRISYNRLPFRLTSCSVMPKNQRIIKQGMLLYIEKKRLLGRLVILLGVCLVSIASLHAQTTIIEPVQACVLNDRQATSAPSRALYASCLGWQHDKSNGYCQGRYQPLAISPLPKGLVQVEADEASLYVHGRSRLKGHVQVRDNDRMVSAQTAYVYRDTQSNQVNRIELLGQVRYVEPGRLMLAQKATINPQDKSGQIEQVLYRFDTHHAGAHLPAWGRASFIERFANQNYLLRQATYTTCAPSDKAWRIKASKIELNHEKASGQANNAVLEIHDWPVLYTPYLTFPTSKERKSGFLLPLYGYSNVGGFDLGLPYYWNIAPNYDATLIPHFYSRRGLMLGGNGRFLTHQSNGLFSAHILPHDKAFAQFIKDNEAEYPSLNHLSTNRWTILLQEHTQFNRQWHLNINYQKVSDDYYLQDFSTNLVTTTENQLPQQAELTWSSEHWLLGGKLESYQTLHPINQSRVMDAYQRLPQLRAQGLYEELPMNSNLQLVAQWDNFLWPSKEFPRPDGLRYHFNPALSINESNLWGYLTPQLQLVENYYDLNGYLSGQNQALNRTIPRYSLDSGLYFERFTRLMGQRFTQTLEPRLYYLYVPYHDQSSIPAFDSDYIIFSYDQLFRNNRFSGFDRIGDANQLAYGVTTRWLTEETGQEKASFSIGQLRYFANRRVQLCYRQDGSCQDNPFMLGYLSPVARYSPVATQANYHLNSAWMVNGSYIFDVYAHATNNAYLNIHYHPEPNHLLTLGYSYLVKGDLTATVPSGREHNALNQATFAYAWPFTDRWSSLGVYSYNISKGYDMMSFLGVQYDTCCWALRLMGGRTFKNLIGPNRLPQYNNNVFVQVLLKGLGSAANGDPNAIIRSYLPRYSDLFHQ